MTRRRKSGTSDLISEVNDIHLSNAVTIFSAATGRRKYERDLRTHRIFSGDQFTSIDALPIMDAIPITKKLIAFGTKKIYLYGSCCALHTDHTNEIVSDPNSQLRSSEPRISRHTMPASSSH